MRKALARSGFRMPSRVDAAAVPIRGRPRARPADAAASSSRPPSCGAARRGTTNCPLLA